MADRDWSSTYTQSGVFPIPMLSGNFGGVFARFSESCVPVVARESDRRLVLLVGERVRVGMYPNVFRYVDGRVARGFNRDLFIGEDRRFFL